jgi:phage terminase large subunit-like protein
VFSPTFYTPALSEDFPSEADWLLPIVRLAWKTADDPNFALDDWQEQLIRRVLELYPAGHARAGELRFRQVVVSMGRQNGKSILGAIFGLYGLLRAPGQMVIGIASSADQARIVYDRTMHVIRSNPSLAAMFDRLTDTRGLRSKDGGKYEIKAANAGALQGLPISVGVVDELHLLKPELWTSLVNGTGGRPNGLVVGITTAGDETSELLKNLYTIGQKAIVDDANNVRFGFFCWEAPESRVPENDADLLEYLQLANPSLAEGRLDAENILSDVRAMPDVDVIRYRLNRFVASSRTQFITTLMRAKCARPFEARFPHDAGRPVFAIDRSPDWGYASIVAAVKDDQGNTWTELVASIVRPTLEQLANAALQLTKHSPQTFIVDGYSLRDLASELKLRGIPCMTATQPDIINASNLAYSKMAQQKLKHDNQPLFAVQYSRTMRKNIGDSFRISRQDSSVEIDAVMAEVLAIYCAETRREQPIQVF